MLRVLFLILITASVSLNAAPNGRIYGGDPAAPGQFPFIASLRQRNEHFCGASIINKNWIVTAGHCASVMTIPTTVLVGTTLQHSGGTEYNISKIIIHEDFNITTRDLKDDIALIQIDGEFEFGDLVSSVEFVAPEDNMTCVVAGWGFNQDQIMPEELLFVEVTKINHDLCESLIEGVNPYYFGEGQVCALGAEGKGACNGDSGGPLVCGGRLAGIVSYSPDPCVKGFPEVYSSPDDYSDWVNSKLEG